MFVTWTLNCDADPEVARDLTEVLTLRVEQGEPLVLDSVLILEIDRRHVKLVRANELVTEDALVHDFDRDGLHLNLA